jgi:hypothetical protein
MIKGFWEFFTPSKHSDAHTWNLDTWKKHLDDMASHGIKALNIYLHGYATGYMSSIPFLDTTPSANRDSCNKLINQIIDHAHHLDMKVFAANHTYIYQRKCVDKLDACYIDDLGVEMIYWPYDNLVTLSADSGYTQELIIKMFEEQHRFFPELDGFLYEGERKYFPGPASKRGYDRWAKVNGKKPYSEIVPEQFFYWLNDRSVKQDWIDYVSFRDGSLVRDVWESLKQQGFTGEMFYCYGTINYSVDHPINAEIFMDASRHCSGFCPYNYSFPTPDDIFANVKQISDKRQVPVMYVVDAQVGWHSAKDDKSPEYMDNSWEQYIEEARQIQPEYLIFFGYEWNSLRNGVSPEENRKKIYRLMDHLG